MSRSGASKQALSENVVPLVVVEKTEENTTFGEVPFGSRFQFIVKGQRSPLFTKIEITYRDDTDPNLGICNCECEKHSLKEWLPNALPVIMVE